MMDYCSTFAMWTPSFVCSHGYTWCCPWGTPSSVDLSYQIYYDEICIGTWPPDMRNTSSIATNAGLSAVAKENMVSAFLQGADTETKLLMWKMLRIEFPHLSSSLAVIEHEIMQERKRTKSDG